MGLDVGSLEVSSSLALTLLYQLAFRKPLASLSFCLLIYKIVMPDGLSHLSLCGGHV